MHNIPCMQALPDWVALGSESTELGDVNICLYAFAGESLHKPWNKNVYLLKPECDFWVTCSKGLKSHRYTNRAWWAIGHYRVWLSMISTCFLSYRILDKYHDYCKQTKQLTQHQTSPNRLGKAKHQWSHGWSHDHLSCFKSMEDSEPVLEEWSSQEWHP